MIPPPTLSSQTKKKKKEVQQRTENVETKTEKSSKLIIKRHHMSSKNYWLKGIIKLIFFRFITISIQYSLNTISASSVVAKRYPKTQNYLRRNSRQI